eukprot:350984-Chlamydomonas_euryale.AAC.9
MAHGAAAAVAAAAAVLAVQERPTARVRLPVALSLLGAVRVEVLRRAARQRLAVRMPKERLVCVRRAAAAAVAAP